MGIVDSKLFDRTNLMNLNLEKYKTILETKGLQEAILYKNQYVPKKLYKFVSLNDDKNENDKRYKSLINNKTWLSGFRKLNDPFEFKSFLLDQKRLAEHNWPAPAIVLTDKMMSLYKNLYYICCFVDVFSSIPMWAYYANNHRGFCVEYMIEKPDYIYKVFYEEQRQKVATIPSYLMKSLFESIEISREKPNNEFLMWNEILKLSFTVKHKSWQHENEFRLIFPFNKEVDGVSINNRELRIKPSRIFVGMECNKENVDTLSDIANKIKCEIFQMKVSEDSLDFNLGYSKIM